MVLSSIQDKKYIYGSNISSPKTTSAVIHFSDKQAAYWFLCVLHNVSWISVPPDTPNNAEVNAEAAVARQKGLHLGGGEGRGVTFTAADHPAAWVVETHPWLYTPNFAMMTDVEKSGHNSLLDTSDVHLRWKSPQWFPAADLRGFHLSGVSYAKHESHHCNQNALKAPCLWH